jgi:hypothetical protein
MFGWRARPTQLTCVVAEGALRPHHAALQTAHVNSSVPCTIARTSRSAPSHECERSLRSRQQQIEALRAANPCFSQVPGDPSKYEMGLRLESSGATIRLRM